MDAIHGLTIEAMAETMSKHNELRAQHGEPAFKPYFLRYLGTKGIDEHTWGQAWNSWHSRMNADQSGQLWARFNPAQSALTMQAHFGDVADMSQEARGGLTLDMYARLSAEAAQPGVDFAAVLARHGVPEAVWHAGSDAWNLAMSQDTMHRITTQYGQLYAKYNPAHIAAMQAQAGQLIANRPESSSQEEEPEVEYTVEAALAELQSPVPRTRWRAAHLLAQKIQTELEGDRAGQRQALAVCVPQLLDCLDRHDKETVSDAESAARDLVELGQKGDEAKGAVSRCLARGREHLATVQAAFAPIQNKNVPERIYLQSEIQDYTSLVETLTEILADWGEASDDDEATGPAAASGRTAATDDEGIAPTVAGARSWWDRIMSLFR